jgi:hypothetical protein
LIVYGRGIEPEDQVKFALAGIHALDLSCTELKLQGPSNAMLIDLIRSVAMTRQAVASKTGPPRPVPSSSNWQDYTTQPSHVPASDLTALFDELARKDWD